MINELNFKRVESINNIFFDKEKETFRNILAVWDCGHSVYVCNPKDVFSKSVRDEFSWDSIDIEKMFSSNNFGMFIHVDFRDAFNYVSKRMEYDSSLAVIEEHSIDGENYYLVRGVISKDKDGYSIALNPEYAENIPFDVWDRSSRYSGKEVPLVYCLKQKK